MNPGEVSLLGDYSLERSVEQDGGRIREEMKLLRMLRELCAQELGAQPSSAEFRGWLVARAVDEERLRQAATG